MLRRVALVRTDVSERRIATIFRLKIIIELQLLVTANLINILLIIVTLNMKTIFLRNASSYKSYTHPRSWHFSSFLMLFFSQWHPVFRIQLFLEVQYRQFWCATETNQNLEVGDLGGSRPLMWEKVSSNDLSKCDFAPLLRNGGLELELEMPSASDDVLHVSNFYHRSTTPLTDVS
jgi:hypothetical protein